ncbi:MAG: PAS domain S-box protein [Pseudomonadales bacterium]
MKTQNPGSLWTSYVLFLSVIALASVGLYWLLDSAAALLLSGGQTQWGDAMMPEGDALLHRLLSICVVVAVIVISTLAHTKRRRLAGPMVGLSGCMQRVFDVAEDIVLYVDRHGKIIELNEAAAAHFGWEALQRSLFDFVFVPVNRENKGEHAAESLLDDVNRQAYERPQFIAKCSDDTQFPAQVSVLRVAGLPTRYAVILSDITAQLTAEKALQHSEKKYRSLFESVPDGVYRSLPDGTLLIANPALVNMLGYSSSEELCNSTNSRELYRNPEDRSRITHALREQGKVRNAEFELRRKNNGFISVLANIHAVRDESADAVVFEGTLSDISDIKNIRGLLNEQAEHFRLYTEHARDIITVLDQKGAIIYSSPACQRVTGFTPATVVNMKILDRIHPGDHDTVLDVIKRGFERPGRSHSMTFRIRHQDGSWRYLESVGSAFVSADKRLRAVINSRDVTDRIATETLLQQAQKMEALGELTGGVAQEFSDLLSIIVGRLELLELGVGRDRALLSHTQTALQAAQQSAELTQRLLTFSRRQALNPKGMQDRQRRKLEDEVSEILD